MNSHLLGYKLCLRGLNGVLEEAAQEREKMKADRNFKLTSEDIEEIVGYKQRAREILENL